MFSPHTPGPWQPGRWGQAFQIRALDGSIVAWADSKGWSRNEARANTNLIATGPELLAAAEGIMNRYEEYLDRGESFQWNDEVECLIREIRRVIDKAAARTVATDLEHEPEHSSAPWRWIASDNGLVEFWVLSKTGRTTAAVLGRETKEEARSNAALVAAAPDLLAACKAWAGWADHIERGQRQQSTWLNAAIESTRRAVAKARWSRPEEAQAGRGSPAAVLTLAGTLTHDEAEAILEAARECRQIDNALWVDGR